MYYLNNSGPYPRNVAMAHLNRFVTPLPLRGYTHGGIWKRTALIFNLFDHYQLPRFQIEVCGYYITIGRQPCNTYNKSSPPLNTPSPNQGELFSSEKS